MTREELLNAFAALPPADQAAVRAALAEGPATGGPDAGCPPNGMQEHLAGIIQMVGARTTPWRCATK